MTLNFLSPDNGNKKPAEEKKENGKSGDILYLERLQFRPELKKTWINFFLNNFRVVILFILLITLWGVYSFTQLPRESNPQVTIPVAVVITAYPGVGPSDIEELVTKKIETAIAGIKGISKITSNSSNSVSSVSIEFEAGEDLTDSIRKVRDQVISAQKDLPADAQEPVVREISLDDTPIFTFAITGPYDGFKLFEIGEDLKDELEKISGVREVNISGGDEREFSVAYDPKKLTFYGISADQANASIKATNLAFPSGSFEGSEYSYPVRTDARFFTVKELGGIPVLHTDNGAIIFLKDIARVEETAIKKTVSSRLSIKGGAPQPSVTVSIIKKTGGNILKTIDEAKSTIETRLTATAPEAKYDIVSDFSKTIRRNFDQLQHDFLLTIALVFGILFLVVGLKEAILAGLAVPFVFLITFGIMDLTGITLNFLSIFCLLLSLGLLVDDAIVVVTAVKQYLRTGKFTPEEAVLLVFNDFKWVLVSTTLATVWAFLPLIFTSGIIGSFIRSVPIVVSVTLVSSLVIAFIVNHPLAAIFERQKMTRNLYYLLMAALLILSYILLGLNMAVGYILAFIVFAVILFLVRWYMRTGKIEVAENAAIMAAEAKDPELIKRRLKAQAANGGKRKLSERLLFGVLDLTRVMPVYEKYLCRILLDKKLKLKVLGAVALLFIFAAALPATGLLPGEFFPASDETIIFISMRASTGLKLEETDKIVRVAEEKLMAYPEITNFATVVGASGGTTGLVGSFGGGSGSSNLASFTVNLSDKEERDITSYDLATKIREDLKTIKEADFSVESVRGGPPSGSAFEARITGDDLQTLDKIARDLKPRLESIPGVIDADISLKDSPAEYTFTLDPQRLELYNLNAAYVGSALRTAIAGTEVTKVLKEGKEIKVIATFDESSLPDLEAVQNLQVLNLRKQPVFIKDVAKVELKPSVEKITRIDQKRAVLLSSGAAGKTSSNFILAEFQKNAKDYKLPAGYSIIYGGANETNADSVKSILQAMALAALLIVSTLILQFNSFKSAFIVLATIPLALIGTFIGLTIFRIPLSFPGLIGVLALFGIVVKNAIILIDKINQNIKTGIHFEDAIIDAGKSRFEAIFITSFATILGIIPVTFSSEIWRALGFSIIFGLMLSSFLTLFVIPIIYSFLMKKEYDRKYSQTATGEDRC